MSVAGLLISRGAQELATTTKYKKQACEIHSVIPQFVENIYREETVTERTSSGMVHFRKQRQLNLGPPLNHKKAYQDEKNYSDVSIRKAQ